MLLTCDYLGLLYKAFDDHRIGYDSLVGAKGSQRTGWMKGASGMVGGNFGFNYTRRGTSIIDRKDADVREGRWRLRLTTNRLID